MTPLIGRREIAALIPHTGAMCLLDEVRFWDRGAIVCIASSHRDSRNPLAVGGQLGAICGIEYAAQAMAVHGGLTAQKGRRPSAGYLASLRDVTCHVARLDLLVEDLEVTATRLAGDPAAALYGFAVRSGPSMILEGRAAVVMDAAPPA